MVPIWIALTIDRMLDAMVMDSIPDAECLASANSLTFCVAVSDVQDRTRLYSASQAVGRAIGPFLIRCVHIAYGSNPDSWCFSKSTPASSWAGRQLVWLMFILISLPSIYLSYRMWDDQADPRKEEEEEKHELVGGLGAELHESWNGPE